MLVVVDRGGQRVFLAENSGFSKQRELAALLPDYSSHTSKVK
jgi:hypothetical protein